jgi:hypothetical protein
VFRSKSSRNDAVMLSSHASASFAFIVTSQTCKACAHALVAASGGTEVPLAFATEHAATKKDDQLVQKRIWQVARCVTTLSAMSTEHSGLDAEGSSVLLKMAQDAAADIGKGSSTEKEMACQAQFAVCTLAGVERMLERNPADLSQFESPQIATHMPCPHCIIKVTRMMLRDPRYMDRYTHKPSDLYKKIPATAMVSRVKALSHYTGYNHSPAMFTALASRPAWSAALEAAGCVMGGKEVIGKQLKWRSKVMWPSSGHINLDNEFV